MTLKQMLHEIIRWFIRDIPFGIGTRLRRLYYGAEIREGCYMLGNVRLGKGVFLNYDVKIMGDVELGNNILVAPNVVIVSSNATFAKYFLARDLSRATSLIMS